MNFAFLYPENPRLISIDQPLFQKLSEDPRWVAEPKYNGNRLLLAVEGNDIEFWNRHGERFDYAPNGQLGEALAQLVEKTEGFCLFDGELRHNKVNGIRHKIVLWDTFVWEGKLNLHLTYSQRRIYLNRCLDIDGFWGKEMDLCLIMGHQHNFKGHFDRWIHDPEIEGLVMKNIGGKLNLSRTSGQLSSWMFKARRPSNSYRF